jgi:hypothetical protein
MPALAATVAAERRPTMTRARLPLPLCVAALAALAGSAATARGADFEGRAEYQVTGPHGAGTMVVWIGGAGVRTETQLSAPGLQQRGNAEPGRMVSLLKASEPGRVYLVDDRRRTYHVVEKGHGDTEQTAWTVERLGSDEVAGYRCERVG